MDALKARAQVTPFTVDTTEEVSSSDTHAAPGQPQITHEAPLAHGVARSAPAEQSVASPTSLLSTRAHSKLPVVTPTIDFAAMTPGDSSTLAARFTVKGNGYTGSGCAVQLTALPRKGLLFENLVTDILGPYEDVVLTPTNADGLVGHARSGAWHLLPPDTLGVTRLAFVPVGDADRRFVDFRLTHLHLTEQLSLLDGKKLHLTTHAGKGLNFTAHVDDQGLRVTGAHGLAFSFGNTLSSDGVFEAKENTSDARAYVRFDNDEGAYELNVVRNNEMFSAKLSQPAHKPQPAPAYRASLDRQGRTDVAAVETLALAGGRTALRFSRATTNGLPSIVYFTGTQGVDADGNAVTVAKTSGGLELLTREGTIQLQTIRPKHDFAVFEGKTAEATVYGPTAINESPQYGDTKVTFTFDEKQTTEALGVTVHHGDQQPLSTAAVRDDEGGWRISTDWISYRVTIDANGGYDVETTWRMNDYASTTDLTLTS